MKKVNLRTLVAAIKKFTEPKKLTWRNGLDFYTESWKEWDCADRWCGMDGKVSKLRTPPRHGKDCSLSLLNKYGRIKKLVEVLSKRASSLDYEGGGYNSCPICGGETSWKGLTVRHRKNCPGAIALRIAHHS